MEFIYGMIYTNMKDVYHRAAPSSGKLVISNKKYPEISQLYLSIVELDAVLDTPKCLLSCGEREAFAGCGHVV